VAHRLNGQRRISGVFGALAGARGRIRRGLKRDEGETLVEMAISTAIVMMLLFGVFDFSMYFYTYHFVSDAAREATRYAIVRGNMCGTQTPNQTNCDAGQTEIASYVDGLDYPGIDPSRLTLTANWNTGIMQTNGHETWTSCGTSDTCKSPGNQVEVTVVYTFPLSVPFLNLQSMNVKSTSQMVISQ
jgi:Flp pilus assembly protein TadG